jgi:hypothetical protein
MGLQLHFVTAGTFESSDNRQITQAMSQLHGFIVCIIT